MTTTSSESISPAGQGLVDILNTKGYFNRSFDIAVSIRVKEGKENELLEKIKIAVPESRKEKGCIQYDISRDLNEPVFVIYERWENGTALEDHLRLFYTKELLDKINEVSSETTLHITSYCTLKRFMLITYSFIFSDKL